MAAVNAKSRAAAASNRPGQNSLVKGVKVKSRSLLFSMSLALILSVSQQNVARPVQTSGASSKALTTANVESLLKESGYSYRKANETAWYVSMPLQGSEKVDVIVIAPLPNMLMVGVRIAEKEDVKITPEFLKKLLYLNNAVSFAKVGLDDDDEVFVRQEINAKTITLDGLKTHIADILTATEKVLTEIAPFLK